MKNKNQVEKTTLNINSRRISPNSKENRKDGETKWQKRKKLQRRKKVEKRKRNSLL